MRKYLSDKYDFQEGFIEKNTLKGTINNVYIDLITYDYPLIKPLHREEDIRMLDLYDLSAMKLSAITDSGTRLKDFIDIAFLSTRMSLNDMLNCYKQKYKGSNEISVLKALVYFDDILNDTIHLTSGSYHFKNIKDRLLDMERHPDHVYSHDAPIKGNTAPKR
jgi:hypothetical protein